MSSSLQDQESSPDFDLEEAPAGGGFDSAATNLLAMLQLNHSTSPAAATTTITAGTPPHQHCTSCGNSTKKRSPTSLNEPSSKRATLLPLSSAAAATPLSSPSTTLQRCHSEPVGKRIQENLGGPKVYLSLSDMLRFLNSQSPESSKAANAVPPSSNPIRRTLSETMSSDFQVVAASTPPRPPAVIPSYQSPSPSSISGEISPNAKRLNRMKEGMRYMRQWWDEVLLEGDEETGSQDNNATNHPKPEDEADVRNEAVWVEEDNGLLMIHFKCPCGKGYEILLSGNKCYYKLV